MILRLFGVILNFAQAESEAVEITGIFEDHAEQLILTCYYHCDQDIDSLATWPISRSCGLH